MGKLEKIVEELIGDSWKYKALHDLSAAAVKKVLNANADSMIFHTGKEPDIRRECAEFRAKLIAFGFDAPRTDELLYMAIMKPLYFLPIGRYLFGKTGQTK
jgi:hypothetical protein